MKTDFGSLGDLTIHISQAYARVEMTSLLEILSLENITVANSVVLCLVLHN